MTFLIKTLSLFLGLAILIAIQPTNGQSSFFQVPSPWVYVCNEQYRCTKTLAAKAQGGTSLAACKLTCYNSTVSAASLWPRPTTKPVLSSTLVPFRADNIKITNVASLTPQTDSLIKEAGEIFLEVVRNMESRGINDSSTGVQACSATSKNCGSYPYSALTHQFNIDVTVTFEDDHLKLTTDESYRLDVVTSGSTTTAYIVAPTFFGARHAMETLSQLMDWDDLLNSLVVIQDAAISDSPVFPHRGLSLDTARTYIEIPLLKRVIDGLSYNKLNALHWHLTDSNSFPFVSNREPLMAVYGAYTAKQIYRPQDIQELVHYAMVRGVKIIPELDQPSHTGAGWEWGPTYGLGDMLLCYGIEPVDDYCYQPPCGVLDPSNNNIYPILNNIYKDMSELFQSDVFHMGGDEVKFKCWNETKTVVDFMESKGWDRMTDEGFLQLWSHFQNESLKQVDLAFNNNQDIILWSNEMTSDGKSPNYLDRDRYIIQFWGEANDNSTKTLIEQGYRLIMSNYDVLYLDCGYSSWVGTGLNNWCNPYKGWQIIYDNSPRKIVQDFGLNYETYKKLFVGGEGALWTETAGGVSIEGKLWPRMSALAERLWTDPIESWQEALPRMRTQRNRLVDRGIAADSIQPQSCDQMDGTCL